MTTHPANPPTEPRLGSSTDRRAIETRRRFIDAGWEMLDELQLAEILRNISVERLAERAGRSERSFWNHFGDLESFVRALLAEVPRVSPTREDPWLPLAALEQDLAGVSRRDIPDALRLASLNNWSHLHDPVEVTTFLRQLLLVSRVPSEPSIAPALRERYWGTYIPELEALYQSVGASIGVRPVSPLSWDDLTITINALVEGLQLHRITAPDRFNDEQVGEIIALAGLGLITTEDGPQRLEDRAAVIAGPQVPLWRAEHGVGPATVQLVHRWLTESSAPRSEPDWHGLVELLDRPRYDITEHLGRTEILGALAMGELITRAAPTPPPDCPESALTAWLCELVEQFRSEPWCASCLLSERLRADTDLDIATVVPLGPDLARALDDKPGAVHDTICNVLLTCSLSGDASPPDEVASVALALHRRDDHDPNR
ncbi:MAG: TetR/AcrR family transcriptional regulator [Microthrixaceae bacterium]